MNSQKIENDICTVPKYSEYDLSAVGGDAFYYAITIELQSFCSSLPRRWESRWSSQLRWIPAFAGMTFRQKAFLELSTHYGFCSKTG